MKKHTKGPFWPKRLQCNNWSVYAADGKAVATLGLARSRSLDEMEANAHLFAAAPELLRELGHLVRLLEPLEKAGNLNVRGLATLNGARAAIAKAAGQVNEVSDQLKNAFFDKD